LTRWRSACDPRNRGAHAADRVAAPGADPAITIIRVFDAPRELVWKEWTEPDRFADWFGGADTAVRLGSVSIDPQTGGLWAATTLAYCADGRAIHWTGQYLHVQEPERIAFTICGPAGSAAADIVVVNLVDLGDGRTEMSFRQYGRRTPAEYGLAEKQWSLEFDRVTERLRDV